MGLFPEGASSSGNNSNRRYDGKLTRWAGSVWFMITCRELILEALKGEEINPDAMDKETAADRTLSILIQVKLR